MFDYRPQSTVHTYNGNINWEKITNNKCLKRYFLLKNVLHLKGNLKYTKNTDIFKGVGTYYLPAILTLRYNPR